MQEQRKAPREVVISGGEGLGLFIVLLCTLFMLLVAWGVHRYPGDCAVYASTARQACCGKGSNGKLCDTTLQIYQAQCHGHARDIDEYAWIVEATTKEMYCPYTPYDRAYLPPYKQTRESLSAGV